MIDEQCRPRCSYCPGFLNRVGKTPGGSQKYRCSNCGTYHSEAKHRIAESKKSREQQQAQKIAQHMTVVRDIRAAGFVTRSEMAQQLNVSLTWVTRLVGLGKLEEIRQRGQFGRYWVREKGRNNQ